jgi:hypothetical protein
MATHTGQLLTNFLTINFSLYVYIHISLLWDSVRFGGTLFADGGSIQFEVRAALTQISRPKMSVSKQRISAVDCVWNVMARTQKPDFVFRRKGRVHLNRQGHQFSRLLAAEVCASAVVMLDTPCSEVVWRVLATHSIRQFSVHFPSRASPCAITFQLDSTARFSLLYLLWRRTFFSL